MSSNDQIILNSLLQQQRQQLAPELSDSEFFEVFAAEQALKDYNLSYEEIRSGIVDGGGDGGIDALYVIANGELVHEDSDLSQLKRRVQLDLIVVQATTSTGFSESRLDRLIAATEDLFDLSKPLASFKSVYNEAVLRETEVFRETQRSLAARFPQLRVMYYLASRATEVHPNVQKKADRFEKWMPRALVGSMVLCVFSALGSQSRGALLGGGVMLAFFRLKSRSKVMTGLFLLMPIPVAIGFMPEKWEQRMRSIETYEQDQSAMGRINAWWMAWNLAKDRPLTGGGFEIDTPRNFARYAPVPHDVHSAHSIYFQILGEHGFVGFGLWLLLWMLTWVKATAIIHRSKGRAALQCAGDLARMMQAGLIAYASGGAFLNLAYFDVPYYLIIAIVLTGLLVDKEVKENPLTDRPRDVAAKRPAMGARAPVPVSVGLAQCRTTARPTRRTMSAQENGY